MPSSRLIATLSCIAGTSGYERVAAYDGPRARWGTKGRRTTRLPRLVMAISIAASVTVVRATAAEFGLQRTLQSLGDEGWVQVSCCPMDDAESLAIRTTPSRRRQG